MHIEFDHTESPLNKWLKYQTKVKKIAPIVAIVGALNQKTGCGKSYTCLKLAENHDPNFNINKVVYTPKDFLDGIDTIEKAHSFDQALVVDEGEITAPANLYYSFMNRAIAYTLSTFRYTRGIAFFAAPSFSGIDKRVRQLVNIYGYTTKVMRGSKPAVFLRAYRISTDMFGDKIYTKKLRMYDKDQKKVVSIESTKINLPSKELQEQYEKKSIEFKRQLRKEVTKEIEKYNKYSGENAANTDIYEIVEEVKANEEVMDSLVGDRGKITTNLVSEMWPQLSQKQSRILRSLLSKMYNLKVKSK